MLRDIIRCSGTWGEGAQSYSEVYYTISPGRVKGRRSLGPLSWRMSSSPLLKWKISNRRCPCTARLNACTPVQLITHVQCPAPVGDGVQGGRDRGRDHELSVLQAEAPARPSRLISGGCWTRQGNATIREVQGITVSDGSSFTCFVSRLIWWQSSTTPSRPPSPPPPPPLPQLLPPRLPHP